MEATEIVAYYRVSTQEQQVLHGLGMQAQCRAAGAYAASRSLPIVVAYEEVETGRKDVLRYAKPLYHLLFLVFFLPLGFLCPLRLWIDS